MFYEQIIADKKLSPHPEGGFYKETYRSNQKVHSPAHKKERSALTDIYFLLPKGSVSKFHKVLHDEIWYWHEGENLSLLLYSEKENTLKELLLGPNGEYKHVVPANTWQAAIPQGAFTFVSCCVAPGFDFDDFTMAPIPQGLKELLAKGPTHWLKTL